MNRAAALIACLAVALTTSSVSAQAPRKHRKDTGSTATQTFLSVSPASPNYGATVTFTATVSPQSGTTDATGSVTFYEGANVVGAAPVASFTATFTTTLLPAGSHSFTARYNGDVTYAPSVSTPFSVNVIASLAAGYDLLSAEPATGTNPDAITAGDLNRDGITDLVVTNYNDSTISVILGTGGGAFSPGVAWHTGANPGTSIITDLNNDGKLDIVTTAFQGNEIDIFVGNGDGSFQIGTTYSTGGTTNPNGLVAADLNGDGFVDLVVSNANGSALVFMNDGTGTLALSGSPIALTSSGGKVVTGDFNQDGKADVAIIVGGNALNVLLGNGDGTFQTPVSYALGNGPTGLVTADLNGDGTADLAASNVNDNTVSVLLGNGDGTFQAGVSYSAGSGPFSLDAIASSGGSAPDLVVADTFENSIRILANNGSGVFTLSPAYSDGAGPTALVATNLDGDSRQDVATSNANGANVSIFLGRTPTTLSLAVSPNPASVGAVVTLTATITPSTVTGTVSFFDAGNLIGTSTIASGVAVMTTSSLAFGTHPLSASFTASGIFGGSVSNTVNEVIQNGSGVTLSASPSAPVLGNPVTITATLSPSSATGTVAFQDGGTFLGEAVVTSGVASITTATLGAGTHSIVGRYSGDANNLAGTSAPLLLTVTAAAGGGFGSPTTYSLGNGPYSIVMGDFNNDGKADLAATSWSANNVTVLYGNGDGTFGGTVTFNVGTNPVAIATGDLNGDGLADLVVVNNGSGTLSVALNNGSGGFNAPASISVGSLPTAVAILDANLDSSADIVVTVSGSNQIKILLGNGDGTFNTPTVQTIGGGSKAIIAADFNNDGIPDLAIACGNGANIAIGKGDGTFNKVVIFKADVGPVSIAAGDLRHTGNLDLVIANAISNDVTVLLGAGNGKFSGGVNYPTGEFPQSVVLTDFNGDGFLDIATADEAVNTVSVLLNDGTGKFGTATAYSTGSSSTTGPIALVAGAFTGSGQADLAVANFGANNLAILLALLPSQTTLVATPNPDTTGGPLTLTATVSPSAATGTVTFYDGTTSVGTASLSAGTATIQVSLPAGNHALTATYGGDSVYGPSTSPVVNDLVSAAPVGVTLTADSLTPNLGQKVLLTATISTTAATGTVTFLNGTVPFGSATVSNGVATMFVSSLPAGSLSLTAHYNGDSSYAAVVSTPLIVNVVPVASYSIATPLHASLTGNGTSVVTGDFNNDGFQDVIVTTATVDVMLGLGNGTLQAPVSYSAGTNPTQIVTADFNLDGKTDLAVVNQGSNNVSILLGNGDGTFGNAVNYLVGTGPVSLAVGDFNKDGFPDIVAANHDSSNVTVLLGNGTGSFQLPVTVTVGGANVSVVTADFNGDGATDFVVADATSNQVFLLLSNGTGGFGSPAGFAAGTVLTSLVAGDLNGDGKPDLVVSNGTASTVTIFLNNGSGGFAAGVPVTLTAAAEAAVITDINGDSKADLVVTLGDGNVGVLIGKGDGTFNAEAPFPAGTTPTAIAVGNFTANGHTQFAVVDGANLDILLDGPPVLTIVAGNSQTGTTGAQFPTALQVSAGGFGMAAANVPVTFTAPSTGPSGYFFGSGATATVNTDSSGVATAPNLIANGTAGAFTVTAAAGTNSVTFNLTLNLNTCALSPGTTLLGFDYSGGTAGITVAASGACSWAAAPDVDWITVTNSTGTGSGAINIMVAPNTAVAPNPMPLARVGHILVAGTLVTVDQGATPQTFVDVPPTAYYFDAANLLYADGLTSGCSSQPLMFCPEDIQTRAQMAVFIVRAIYGNDQFTYPSTPKFADVGPSDFGFPWIQKLADLGITSGCGTNSSGDAIFCPDDPVTRDQMAVFIVRMRLGVNADFYYPTTPYFTDVPADYWAFKYIQRMKYEGITSGCSPTQYCPASTVTRGDAAIFLVRGGFNQLLPAGAPYLSTDNKPVVTHDTTADVTFTGVNTHFEQGTTTLAPIPGVLSVNSVTVTDATHVTVNMTFDSTIPQQPETVDVITGTEEAILPNGLTIQ
jgi:hypothetical protein